MARPPYLGEATQPHLQVVMDTLLHYQAPATPHLALRVATTCQLLATYPTVEVSGSMNFFVLLNTINAHLLTLSSQHLFLFPVTASYLIPVDNLLVTGPSGHGSTRSGKGNKAALKKVRSLHAKRMRKLKEKENQSVKSVVVKSRGKHESPTSMITGTPTPLILTEDGKIKGNQSSFGVSN